MTTSQTNIGDGAKVASPTDRAMCADAYSGSSQRPSIILMLRSVADRDDGLRAGLVPDAGTAATALVHGASVASTDAGFAWFPRLAVVDPLQR